MNERVRRKIRKDDSLNESGKTNGPLGGPLKLHKIYLHGQF